jgi:hypothetical protein
MLKAQQKIDSLHWAIGFGLMTVVFAFADVCAPCKTLKTDLQKEQAIHDSYLALKKRNEDYLKKTGLTEGAVIKVQSNLLLINIKIETSLNKIEALQLDQKKMESCSNCG